MSLYVVWYQFEGASNNDSGETPDDVYPKSDLDLNYSGPRIRWSEWSKFRMQVTLSLVADVTVKGVLSSDMLADTDSAKQAWKHSPEKHLAYRKAMEDDLNGGFKSVSVPSSLTGQYMDAEGNHAGAVRFSRASGGQGSAHRTDAGAIGRSQ